MTGHRYATGNGTIWAFAALAAMFVCGLPGVGMASVTVGVIGNSYTHSYQFSPRTNSFSWTDQLGGLLAYDPVHSVAYDGPSNSGITFGGGPIYATAGTYPQRYPYNWAEGGATSSDALGQLGSPDGVSPADNLADQIAAGGIDAVVVAGGLNDALDAAGKSQSQAQAELAQAVSNIEQIISNIRSINSSTANMPIVLANIADPAATPSERGNTKIHDVTAAANSELLTFAQQHDVALVDWFSLSDLGINDFTLPGTSLTLINSNSSAGDTSNDPTNANPAKYFWADTVHPTTIPQGLFADVIVKALQTAYPDVAGNGVTNLLTGSQILSKAGVDPGVASDFSFDYSQYVLTPSPASGALVVMAVAILLMWRGGRDRRRQLGR